MFNKLMKTNSVPVKQPRVAYIALNDGIRIPFLRTLEQNETFFETRMGMSSTQAAELAQAINRVFEASS